MNLRSRRHRSIENSRPSGGSGVFRSHVRFALALLPSVLLLAACGAQEPAEPMEEPTPVEASVDPDTVSSGVEAAGDTASSERPAEPDRSPAVGIYKGFFPGASSPGLESSLYLNADGSVRLLSDYLNEEPPIEEVGTWREAGGQVEVTLTGQATRPYDEPAVHVLSLTDDGLASSEWIGPWWRLSALAVGLEPPYDVDYAREAIEDRGFLGYYKHFAPSASCCGQDYTLLLGTDDIARLRTDFHNGEPPIVDEGTWSVDDQGRAAVELTERPGGTTFDRPIVFALAHHDGRLEAIDYDERMLGEAGLTFYLYPALAVAQQRPPGGGDDGGDAGEGG